MIQAHLAEFIDDDRCSAHLRMAQQVRQQRGLTAAEKSCQDRYRDHFHFGRLLQAARFRGDHQTIGSMLRCQLFTQGP